MKDNNYIVIQGWMVNKLNLSGNELMVYAIIYGFSQDEESKFEGSGQYIADSLGISRRQVFTILENLVKYRFVKKIERFEKNLKFCDYQASPEFFPEKDKKEGGEETSPVVKLLPAEGGEKTSPVVKIFHHEGGEKTSPVVKKLHRGGEKTSPEGGEKNSHHITNTYLNDTTTTAPKQPDLSEEAPTRDETAAAAVLSPEDIKAALLAIDRALLLKTDFYPRAAAFMSLNYLDSGYFAWLYKQCELREPDKSFEGLFFTLFFAENMVEKYKISKKPPPPSQPPEFKCPVCGTIHDKQDDKCPLCSLPKDASPERVILHKELLSLTPKKRDEFLEKETLIFNSCSLHDYKKMQTMTDNLKKEFGIGVEFETSSRSYHP